MCARAEDVNEDTDEFKDASPELARDSISSAASDADYVDAPEQPTSLLQSQVSSWPADGSVV